MRVIGFVLVIIASVIVAFAQGDQAWRQALQLYRWAFVPEAVPENTGEQAVTAPEVAAELAEQHQREQLISIGEYDVHTLDDEYKYIVIPITQIGLGREEISRDFVEGEMEEKIYVTGSRISDPARYQGLVAPEMVDGEFSNIVVFEPATGQISKVFDTRIAVSAFQLGFATDPEVIVVFANSEDRNKDGVLNDDDRQDLYLYYIAERRLEKVDIGTIWPIDIPEFPASKFVIFRARPDRNGDDKYDSETEPALLYSVDLESRKISLFIPGPMLNDMQRLLEAGKKPSSDPPAKPQGGQ
jgi:hypothetical protein